MDVEPVDAETVRAAVRVTDTGERRGRHVVQLPVVQGENEKLPPRALPES